MRRGLELGVAFGPLALLLVSLLLLNRRDRRRDALHASVGPCLRDVGLHEAVAVDVAVGVWLGGARVTLDMRLCSERDVWRMIERLHPQLPREATLRVFAISPCRQRCDASFHRAVVAVV